jgi:hypothetical protein
MAHEEFAFDSRVQPGGCFRSIRGGARRRLEEEERTAGEGTLSPAREGRGRKNGEDKEDLKRSSSPEERAWVSGGLHRAALIDRPEFRRPHSALMIDTS